MDCQVVVEAAIPVSHVDTVDEALRIAIAKTGEMLNPGLNYVEIEPETRTAPSGEALSPAFVVADNALIALTLEMTVFNVENEVHASRVALTEIGQQLDDISLTVREIETLADTNGDQTNDDVTQQQ
ncbi:DUF555 domain-containing protein [Haladaptatus pallidirubidus]|uniref:DUF555 domain-containing protein n=1 Tax=Haladaptatus pallidirubidus TaxID=1008152 RepID=A0AAV3UQU6_9EURY|nr:DUF555 domain-containing protein [Haladaptatus pallidirubidus]